MSSSSNLSPVAAKAAKLDRMLENSGVRKAIRSQMSPFGNQYGLGRQSNNGITATVFGAYGFMGRYFVNDLGRCGTRVYVPFRGCEMEVRHLKPSFDLGARDEKSIVASLQHSDVVINFIGKHYETKHIVHVTIPQRIARLAKEAGVKSFIHISALSASPDSTSEWSRSKFRGELAVREVFPEAIIVKPATVFGPEDRFLNWIAEWNNRPFFFPLIKNGSTLTQPVYVGDIAKALMGIMRNYQAYEGRTFQLAGPAEYSYKELVEFVSDLTMTDTTLVDVPVSAAQKAGKVLGEFINPFWSEDMCAQVLEDNILRPDPDLLTFQDLDLGGHFNMVQGYH
eukprot:gene33063-42774_t